MGPHFIPEGTNRTFAEISFEEKQYSSMRKKAVEKLRADKIVH
jgi:inosine/xanthosine triphosphate pyrophosphatase family protein